MCRLLVAVLAVGAILATPATALAKGPSGASISGPGLAAPLRVDHLSGLVGHGQLADQGGLGEPGQFGALMQHAGFSEGVWGRQAGRPPVDEPEGELGPRYTVLWTLPGPTGADDTVRQELYPYAEAGPVTHVTPGQAFFDGQHTAGGWFAGGPELSTLLLDLGLRAPAPTPPPEPAPPALVGLGGVTLALGCGVIWGVARARRARRPAAVPG